MTPTQRRACLDALGWSQRGLARILGRHERDVRRWFVDSGFGHWAVPPDIDAWLNRRAAAMRDDPPPDTRGREP